MTRKKIVLFVLALAVVVIFAIIIYFRLYQTLPELAVGLITEGEIPGQDKTVLVISPHPDDETIGAGGFIKKSVENKAKVVVIFVTNGDGHLLRINPHPEDYVNSGYERQEEAKKALSILGVEPNQIIFLGYPDNGIDKLLKENWAVPYTSLYTKQNRCFYSNCYHSQVEYTGFNLESDLKKIVADYKPDFILTTHPNDIHPDHAACASFVSKAISDSSQKPELLYFLVHFKNFPNPKGEHKDRYLTPPARLVNLLSGWLKISLDGDTLNIKEQALAEYKSQLRSPLLKSLMEGFLKKNEIFEKARI